MRTAHAKIELIDYDGKRIPVRALFDSGSNRSVMSLRLARQLSMFRELPGREISTAGKDMKMRSTGFAASDLQVDGCVIEHTLFIVSPDLDDEDDLVIGRDHLDMWDVVLDKDGPHLKKCPVMRI